MRQIHYFFSLIIIFAFTLNACENPATSITGDSLNVQSVGDAVASKTDVNHFRVKFVLPLTLGIPCIDEEVAIGSGVRHLLVHEVSIDNGNLFRFHLNHSRITGIGSETGNEYVGQLILNEQEVSFMEKGESQSFQLHIHGVSKGSSPNWFVSMLIHLTLNANGDITADTELVKAECRG